jgi:hypothetical protein
MKIHALLVGSLVALMAVGCSGSDGLTVEGTAAFSVDGTAMGFSFDERSRLSEPLGDSRDGGAEPQGDGTLAGYCMIGGDGFSVGISRTRIGEDEGVQARYFDIDFNADGFEVSAQLGEDLYVGGAANCIESELDYGDGFAVVALDCMLTTTEGAEAGLSASLSFENCFIESVE